MALLPPEAREVLAWWLPRLRALLGDDLRGVWLYGSASVRAFEPAWSDLDFCAELKEAPSGALVEPLGRLHADAERYFLAERHGGWRSTQLLEGTYVGPALAADASGTGPFVEVATRSCHLGRGDPVPGFHRYMLAHHAEAIAGAPRPFASPPRSRLVASQSWLLDLLARPATDHSSIMLAGLLQEAARSLVFWRDGVFLDKSAALEREIERGGCHAEALRLALRLRRAGSASAHDHREELVMAYAATAPSMREELAASTRRRSY